MKGDGKRGPSTVKGWFTPRVRNPEKYLIAELILLAGRQHWRLPRAANTLSPPLVQFYIFSLNCV